MARNQRKTLDGKVIKAFAPELQKKTITVIVDTYKKHPIYSKRYKSSKKFAVHDPLHLAQEGDLVKIMETRPLSARKRFRLVTISQKGRKGA